ncbi:Ni/Fe hydrogenase subunit alpha [Roseibacterium sp. SDUM158016]|uniref:Ni/Fe hydrogenase subunit alpha n=1 Tax=Roseicyclus sediminis TaxID=2980997 RepID=UPI0021D3A044|nr:Ni/Fe hydrogenase subunit alpha [Roseibacterium sp. SDUM158016]MCU4653943.1 Ni/Fe hydrogenase subunit alpha [Roseibacterium sp. SDUM158016]
MTERRIEVGLLTRVEGEGAVRIDMRGDKVTRAEFRIFEPPRFFEALLRGRGYEEAADITSRICGICPVAYQMSAVHAMEAAFGVGIDPSVRLVRRLLYCGEWIESHVLHAILLHAPDYLGYGSAFELAAAGHEGLVRDALEVKEAGNRIVSVVGGREIHPINVRVGGFWKLPERRALAALREELLAAIPKAVRVLDWTASLDIPDHARDYTLVSLWHPDEYPMNEGRLRSTAGLDCANDAWRDHFEEFQVPHSNALQARDREGGEYLVGPMARLALNFGRLSEGAREAAGRAGLGPDCRNPFRTITMRMVETLHALEEAVRLIEAYQPGERSAAPVEPRAGVGAAATEAPRGTLFHRYEIDGDGLITHAQIVPPTSQNQPAIEADLRAFLPSLAGRSEAEITHLAEQAIRNYDPCISCATHFLDLRFLDA